MARTDQNSDKNVQERMLALTHATICNVVIHMVLMVTFIISARKGGFGGVRRLHFIFQSSTLTLLTLDSNNQSWYDAM